MLENIILDKIHKSLMSLKLDLSAKYGIAVSGGSDSVALLHILKFLKINLHVIHLDHLTRDGESTKDAEFVNELCNTLNLPLTSQKISDFEFNGSNNVSEHYRKARIQLFKHCVDKNGLVGVFAAHHQNDQAETVYLRLNRGGPLYSMSGIKAISNVNGVKLIRPMLEVEKQEIITYLTERNISWKEDISNNSDKYARNKIRKVINNDNLFKKMLLDIGSLAFQYKAYLDKNIITFNDSVSLEDVEKTSLDVFKYSLKRFLESKLPSTVCVKEKTLKRVLDTILNKRTCKEDIGHGITLIADNGTVAFNVVKV
jgi:tRNA(Ile)-lysidine synthetase-like protein